MSSLRDVVQTFGKTPPRRRKERDRKDGKTGTEQNSGRPPHREMNKAGKTKERGKKEIQGHRSREQNRTVTEAHPR